MTASLPPYSGSETRCPNCGCAELWHWQTQERVAGAGRVSLADHWRCATCVQRWAALTDPYPVAERERE